jgi:hypothetical protein
MKGIPLGKPPCGIQVMAGEDDFKGIILRYMTKIVKYEDATLSVS